MSRVLPEHPDFEHLKHQAKSLLQSLRDGNADASERFRAAGVDGGEKLADAQHVVAREYGFKTWPALKAHVASLAASPAEALVLAIKADDETKVRQLIGAHPDLKATIDRGTDELGFGATPLIGAVQRDNRAMIDTLLAAGADLAVKSDWWAGGFSVLESASEELAPFLIERGAVVDAAAAAKFGMLGRLADLIVVDPGVVHQRSGDGKTPLHWAKDVATTRLLVEHGADINARDVDHESTAAQYAVRERTDVARYLVAAGCDTDIFLAAALGDLERTRQILNGDPHAVEMTISPRDFPMRGPRAGGIIYIWTLGQGKSPQIVAQEFGNHEVYALLMERSPNDLKLAQACLLGDELLFEQFLARREKGAPVALELARQLVGAAMNNSANAVRLLLKAGWPVAVEADQGGTALHWSAWHGNPAMMRAILEYHPPLDVRDKAHNMSPLGWALHGSLHGWHAKTGDYGAVVTTLLEAGAATNKVPATLEGSPAAMAAYRKR